MTLGMNIRKEVAKKEKFFNECLEIEEDIEEIGRVFLEYSFKMNNAQRDPEDKFRILLYPENTKGKLVFYCSGNYMKSFYKSMAEQFKEYCITLERVEESEKEYRKIWEDLTRMYGGPDLIKVDFSKTLDEFQNQTGNNILSILDEKHISIREMSIDMNLDYAGLHRLVNKDSLENVTLKKLLEVAEYLKVDIQDLYK